MSHSTRRSLFSLSGAALLALVVILQGSSYRLVHAEDQSRPSGVAASAASIGIWYGGSNPGTLTNSPTSIVQPAPRITRAGNYMFIGNLSVQETTGGYPIVNCSVQVGSAMLLTSTEGVSGSQQGNVTATGAIALTSTQVPVTASLMCDNTGGGTAQVLSGSISIFSVGTLQIGK